MAAANTKLQLESIPISLRSYGTPGVRERRIQNPNVQIRKGEGLDVDACPGVERVRKGETVPERFEAKPGDLKLVVFRGPEKAIGPEVGWESRACTLPVIILKLNCTS